MGGRSLIALSAIALAAILSALLFRGAAIADELKPEVLTLKLTALIDEALKNNREARASGARQRAAGHRPGQLKSLPDPMFMVGYQNEGYDRYTYGEMPDAQWMFTASQMVPYPGKLGLKGNMAQKEAEGLAEMHGATRQKVVAEVRERFYDLFLAYKSLDLIDKKYGLVLGIEEAASARYTSGMAPQQEVIMAQTEKFMLLEKKEMLRQKIEAGEAMLRRTLGREEGTPLGRPEEPLEETVARRPGYSLETALSAALSNSPEVKAKRRMVEASDYSLQMAKKEYYPDFTFTGQIAKRGGEFDDMWSLSAAVNVPIFYKSKQRGGVLEAEAARSASGSELEDTELMVASAVRDNYSMAMAAYRLMELYRDGLMPKTRQGLDAALSGYRTGKVELTALINSLTALIDYETLYWGQFVEKEKAMARLDALAGVGDGPGAIYLTGKENK